MALVDLTAVKRRVADAKSELDALRAQVDAFVTAVPPPWRLEREDTPQTEALVSYVDRQPRAEWGDQIGYVAVKARTALDQLVTQLVIDSGNDPAKRKSYFPIYADAVHYHGPPARGGKSQRDRKLDGVASRHRAIIDQLQPFQRGSEVQAKRDPLYVLNAINNREKHEDTHAVWAAVAGTRFRIIFGDGRVDTVNITKDDDPGPLVNGQVVVGADSSDLLPKGSKILIEIDEIRVGLAFEGRITASLDQVDQAVLHVSRIVERFERRIANRGHENP
jgi:hypothetical protein